jgi:hypothetical protein
MKFMKCKGTKGAKKLPSDFHQIKTDFVSRAHQTVEEHHIPLELIISLDETGLPVVPVSDWTLDTEDT